MSPEPEQNGSNLDPDPQHWLQVLSEARDPAWSSVGCGWSPPGSGRGCPVGTRAAGYLTNETREKVKENKSVSEQMLVNRLQ